MYILFSTFAILISILAIFINQWVTFLPQLGIAFQYQRRRVQLVIAVLAIGTAAALYLTQQTTGQLIVLIVVLLLTPLSGLNHARRFLIAVDDPKQVPAAKANWQDDALVLGYAADEKVACAWLLDTLIPHHLVNDLVNGVPMLAAW